MLIVHIACAAILALDKVPHWDHPDDISLIRSTLRPKQDWVDVSIRCSVRVVHYILMNGYSIPRDERSDSKNQMMTSTSYPSRVKHSSA